MNIAHQRLHNQRLIGRPFERPEDVVRWLGAVQSQDYPGAKWGIAQRMQDATDSELDRAFNDGRILRTHVMRPTWHFVLPEDIRWLLELTAPRVLAIFAHYERRNELDLPLLRRSATIIEAALRGGNHLTRAEIGLALETGGVAARGMRLGFIVSHAELEGLVCSGAIKGKQHTYALLAERAPQAKSVPREEALAILTRRYFTSHGPAQLQDFGWWSGLTMTDVRAGVESVKEHLVSEVIDGKTYWSSPLDGSLAALSDPTIHLLPNYDELLVAYKDHDPSFDQSLLTVPASLPDVLALHIATLNGYVIGGWRRTLNKADVTIQTRLLLTLNDAQQQALQAAAESYGRFLGRPVTIASTEGYRP